MKNEYVIENALLDAVSEINAEWIEQAADYEVTRKIIPFPYKYAVVAANLFLCVICAVAFSLTKLNSNTDPSDFEKIFGTNTEEPNVIIADTEEPEFNTKSPEDTDKPMNTKNPEASPVPTSAPVVTVSPTENPVVTPSSNLRTEAPVISTDAPVYATGTPAVGTVTEPPMERIALPKRQLIEQVYESRINGAPIPMPTEDVYDEPPVSNSSSEAPAVSENPVTSQPQGPPMAEPPQEVPEGRPLEYITMEEYLEIFNQKYIFNRLDKFVFDGKTYELYSEYVYGVYEVYFATNESNIDSFISTTIAVSGTEMCPGMVYRLKGIDPNYAVAFRYDGYEEYIIAIRYGYSCDSKLKKMLNEWL